MCKKIAFCALLFLCITVFSSFASEPFPSRPIEIIVPWDPGGGIDLMVRCLAPKMSEKLGQPVIITNKPGSAGTLGATYASQRKPDGYTLVAISPSNFVFTPHLQKVEYNPLKDFTFIAGVMAQPFGIQVRSDAPWKTIQELLDDAKKNPEKINYGSNGFNSVGHVFMENIAYDLGITWTHIPFKGDAPLVTAMLGGHVMCGTSFAGWVPHAVAGRLRPLVFLTEKRFNDFPNVPTLSELFKFNYYWGATSLNCIGAPKGVPDEIIKKLEDTIRSAADSPEFKKAIETFSHEVYFQKGADFKRSVENGFNSIGEMITRMKAKQ